MPSEPTLATDFQVSRIVIREALKTLEERGLLVVRQGAGTTVDDRSHWNMLDADVLDAVIRHDPTTRVLENLVAVRATLESELVAGAAQRASSERWDELGKVVAEMMRLTEDPVAYQKLDAQFHATVIAGADNEVAAAIVSRIHAHAMSSPVYIHAATPEQLQVSAEEHGAILAHLLERDGAAAAAAMRAHIIESWTRKQSNA